MKKYFALFATGFMVGLAFFLGPLSITGKFVVLGADYLPSYFLDNVFVVGLLYAVFFGLLLTIANRIRLMLQKKTGAAPSLFLSFLIFSIGAYLSFSIVLYFVLAYSFSHFGNIIFG